MQPIHVTDLLLTGNDYSCANSQVSKENLVECEAQLDLSDKAYSQLTYSDFNTKKTPS